MRARGATVAQSTWEQRGACARGGAFGSRLLPVLLRMPPAPAASARRDRSPPTHTTDAACCGRAAVLKVKMFLLTHLPIYKFTDGVTDGDLVSSVYFDNGKRGALPPPPLALAARRPPRRAHTFPARRVRTLALAARCCCRLLQARQGRRCRRRVYGRGGDRRHLHTEVDALTLTPTCTRPIRAAELYQGRLKKYDRAIALRIRWYGKEEGLTKVFHGERDAPPDLLSLTHPLTHWLTHWLTHSCADPGVRREKDAPRGLVRRRPCVRQGAIPDEHRRRGAFPLGTQRSVGWISRAGARAESWPEAVRAELARL